MKRDVLLNIIASIILTVATQIVAYPFLGWVLTPERYGLILTVMGVANTCGVALGNSLNNSKLLLQKEYDRRGISGDFNWFMAWLSPACIMFSIVGCWLLGLQSLLDLLLIAAIALLVQFRSYYLVAYRIDINYKRIMIASCWGLAGYVFGVALAYWLDVWQLVFLLGELLQALYIAKSNPLLHEPFSKTELFGRASKKSLALFLATLLGTGMTYMDRFFLFPILGPSNVAIYTTASLLGKTLSIVATPLSGVLLTYYAKEDGLISVKDFFKRVVTFVLVCAGGYLLVILVSKPILSFLYPSLISDATPYLVWANAAAVLMVLGNLIQPTMLKCAADRWQPIMQGLYLIAYFSLAVYGSITGGLLGFCIAISFANLFRIVVMCAIVLAHILKDSNTK